MADNSQPIGSADGKPDVSTGASEEAKVSVGSPRKTDPDPSAGTSASASGTRSDIPADDTRGTSEVPSTSDMVRSCEKVSETPLPSPGASGAKEADTIQTPPNINSGAAREEMFDTPLQPPVNVGGSTRCTNEDCDRRTALGYKIGRLCAVVFGLLYLIGLTAAWAYKKITFLALVLLIVSMVGIALIVTFLTYLCELCNRARVEGSNQPYSRLPVAEIVSRERLSTSETVIETPPKKPGTPTPK